MKHAKLLIQIAKHLSNPDRACGNYVFSREGIEVGEMNQLRKAFRSAGWKVRTVSIPGDGVSRPHQRWVVVSQ